MRQAALQSGDLVFLDLACGSLCDAIEQVTQTQFSVSGPALSHVGLIQRRTDGSLWVVEAWPAAAPEKGGVEKGGVVRTPLAEVLARVSGAEGEPGGYRFGRLAPAWRELGKKAVAAALQLLGRPYDERFLPDNQAYYCSELVYEAFARAAGAGAQIRHQHHRQTVSQDRHQTPFSLLPMFYGGSQSTQRRTWETYFAQKGMKVPDGVPGISPLGLYLQGQRRAFLLRSTDRNRPQLGL